MDDRSRHRLRRAGDIAPWIVGVLAVGAFVVPVAGSWTGGDDTGLTAAPAPAPRRISFQRPLRSAVHPRLQAPALVLAPTTVGPATTPALAVPVTPAPPALSAATTRPARGSRLPAGFASPGKSYVFVDQPSRKAGARSVAVLGDSLTVGASPGLQAFLSDVNLKLDARVSRPTLEGVQAAASTRATTADIVVVALGSNDSCTAAECRRRVDAVLAAIGPKPTVVWMSPAQFRPNMQAMRAAIGAAATRGRMSVLDWQPYLDDHPEIKSQDGIHLTADGYRLRAQVTADQVHRVLASR